MAHSDDSHSWDEQRRLINAALETPSAGDAPNVRGGLDVDSIPGYEILREIHRGGQGIVYHAVQKSTRRTVAVKIMREGPFAGPVGRARFDREIRILGALHHPNIVTVHDSGTVGPVSYYVMDFIPGRPLDDFLKSMPCGIPEIFELFAKLAEAVNAAHLRGVIHRDLKPGNVCVDPSGEPHVLDFGLAKVDAFDVLADSSAATMTHSGMFVGSLPWASPEQTAGRPDQIDIRTDVYSLGVMLYHALTGRFPYEVTGSLHDVLGSIRTALPMPLRRAWAEMHGASSRPPIDDEASTIVLKCLSKERERRYQSAGELSRDLRRYLAGEPIDAKGDSGWYLLRKGLYRYRVAVGLVLAALCVLTTAAIVSSAGWREAAIAARSARTQQQAARDAQQLAEKRATEVQAVADFQARMLSDVDAEEMGRGLVRRLREQVEAGLERAPVGEWPDRRPRTSEEVSAALTDFDKAVAAVQPVDVARSAMDDHVLRRAAEALATEFAGEPLVRAQLHLAIGHSYFALGLYRQAEQHVAAALDLQRPAPERVDRTVARTMNFLATLRRQTGDLAAAESLLREALVLQHQQYGAEHPEIAESLENLGLTLEDRGQLGPAQDVLIEALNMRKRLLGDAHVEVASSMNDLASLYSQRGQSDSAESLLREALAANRRRHGDDSVNVAISLNNLAALLREQGDYAGAEPLYREALAINRRLLGPTHAYVSSGLNNLASILRQRGDLAAAEPLFRESLSLRVAALGGEHPAVANGMSNLAMLLQDKGELPEAERLFREALSLRKRLFGEEHVEVVQCMSNLADLLRTAGRRDEAEALARTVLEQQRRLNGPQHLTVANSLNNLAMLLLDRGALDEAESLHREALAMYRKLLGDRHPTVAISMANLADTLRGRGEFAPAERLLRDALAIETDRFGSDHRITIGTSAKLARVLVQQSRFADAEALLAAAQRTLDTPPAPARRLIERTLTTSIELYEAWHAAEPDQGHDRQAADWRARLAAWRATTQPSSP